MIVCRKQLDNGIWTCKSILGLDLTEQIQCLAKDQVWQSNFRKISPFLTSVHCVAHRTNLAALEAVKYNKCLSTETDALVNSMPAYFKNSGKKKCALDGIQK